MIKIAYINYQQKEDAQDDTLRFIAEVLYRASDAIRERDPFRLHTECKIMILTFKEKLNDEEREKVSAVNDRLREILYHRMTGVRDGLQLTLAMDMTERLYEYLCGALIRRGILLRAEADLDSIVARRSA